VGITPFRGIIDDTDRPEDVVLIYRNRSRRDAVFIDDLEGLSQAKGFGLHLSFSRIGERDHNPFLPGGLEELVPDVADREVFVVGSSSLISAARSTLRAAGVPGAQIHYENFTY
jgi:ferredoxin-NADP reductase